MSNVESRTSKKLFETMVRIRFFEERTKKLYRQNHIYGALHLCIGQEAIAAGVCAGLHPGDYVVSTHRGHGHSIAKGAEVSRLFAELMGRSTGYSGGYGGSMHIFSKELGLLGGNGIVGGGIPISVGAGFSAKYRKSGQVTICFFGDGAANQGTFHESLNMAALWKLPVVYVCENNTYAATTRAEDVTATVDIAPRAGAYGMKGVIVDGNDVEVVYEAAKAAIDFARNGGGPTLLECKTFRTENHCMVIHQEKDPQEAAHWESRDPIKLYEEFLIKNKVFDVSELNSIKDSIKSEIAAGEEVAMESNWPGMTELVEFE